MSLHSGRISRPQHVVDRIYSTQERRELVRELQEVQEGVEVETSSLDIISSERCSIYKIPKFMRKVDPRAYEPRLVSFGPYHYGKPHLLPMESMKHKGFCNFLDKHENLEPASIVDSVSLIFKHLWDSYDKLDQKWKQNPVELLKVMIVDGCFMLDFLENNCPSYLHYSKISEIKRDMMLLENQLPMELLQHLYSLANVGNLQVPQGESEKLFRSLICEKILSIGTQEAAVIRNKLHILDIYRESLLLSPDNRYQRGVSETYDRSGPGWCQIIPPATELLKLGIKFTSSHTKSFTSVYFDPKQAVLGLPYLVLSNDIDTRLLNVMAFEKLHKYAGSQVMSYVRLMKNLIVDDKDVTLLVSRGILSINESTGVVVELFNRLGKAAKKFKLDSHISTVFKQLNDHCNNPWTKWWVNLKDPRTQNPWVIISIAAASFGFLLQIIQTTFQVYEHFRPPH